MPSDFEAQIEWRSPDSLTPYVNNAKQHPQSQIDKIAASIAEFGFTVPVVVDGKGVLIAGHGRLAAAQKLHLDKVPVIVRDDLTKAQVKALRIADNKVAESAWDNEALKLELEALAELDFDLGLTGWDESELEQISNGGFGGGDESGDAEADEGLAEELVSQAEQGEIVTRVNLGEIWACGRHRVMCGDSTDVEQVRQLLGNASIDIVWADPPYGVNIVKVKQGLGSVGAAKPFGSKDKRGSVGASAACSVGLYAPIAGDNSIDTAIDSYALCQALVPEAVMFYWGGNYYAHRLPSSPCWIIWDKRDGMTSNNFADAEIAWTNQTTPCRVFSHLWSGMIKASEHGQKRVHPTQKPEALATWCFDKYGKPSDTIFDPFLGSGMSLLAAQKMEGDRTVYGCELSPDYCEVILRRFESFTGLTAQLVTATQDSNK